MALKSSKELWIFIVIAISLFVWFFYLNDVFQSLFGSNFMLGYLAFFSVYTFLVMRYILEIHLDARHFIAFVFVFLALDIILYPIMISKDAPPTLTFSQSMSSDIFIYNLLPNVLPHQVKYYVTYVVVPALLLVISRMLISRKTFWNITKQNL